MKKLNPYYLSLGLFASSFAFAQGGGVSGGGNIVDVDHTPELLDFVNGTTCDWKQGFELTAQIKGFDDLFLSLSKVDWYFAMSLRQQIEALKFCMTGPLYRVSPLDWDSPVELPAEAKKYRQAAYRVGNTVYADQKGYLSLSPSRQAYLLIHEAMHAFIPMRVDNRKIKHRTMVKAIRDAIEGRLDRSDLYQQMIYNSCAFPFTVSDLDANRKAVEFRLAGFEQQQKMILAETDLDQLLLPDDKIQFLTVSDQSYFDRAYQISGLEQALTRIVVRSDDATFESLFSKQSKVIDLNMLALASLSRMPEARQNLFLKSSAMGAILAKAYGSFDLLTAEATAVRVMTSSQLSSLMGGSFEKTPLISLSPQIHLSFEMKALSELMVVLVKAKKQDAIASLMTENQAFYDAFGLKKLIASVAAMNPAVPREKPYAVALVAETKQKLIEAFLFSVKSKLTEAEYESVRKQIHFERF